MRGFFVSIRRLVAQRWAFLAAAVAILAATDYASFGFMSLIDLKGGDVLIAANARRRPVSDLVVIVDIDQRSLELMNAMAGSWPWPRSVHGELIDYVEAHKPQAIVFDVLFNELDVYRPQHDAAFADAVARYPNVWLAMTLNNDGKGARVLDMPRAVGMRPLTNPPSDTRVPAMLPLVLLSHPEAMRGGLTNFTMDSDGVGRGYALYLDRAGWRFPSLPARVVASLGRPLPRQQSVMLNYRRGWRHIAYADLYLDSLRSKPLRDPNELQGKIVLVGTSAPGLMDMRLTPLDSNYPGVEVLATAIDNLDRGDWLREVPRPYTLPFALLLIGVIAVAFARGVSAVRTGYALLAITAVALAAAWLALVNGTFVPIFAPLAVGWGFYLASTTLAYLDERAQRLRTAGAFKRFLDPQVVTELISRGAIDYRTQAAAREVTVLFSDIRGFTTLSETAAPEEVVALLNRYFTRQVGIIFKHGGTLDKFMGDGIMAFWGAPTAYPDHARRAVAAALDMSAALDEFRGELGALGAALDIGIGLHTGNAVVGFIGSDERLDYTAIGDTVNSASRIEGLTKGLSRILASEATREAAGEAFDWHDHGLHRAKGRGGELHLFQPARNGSIAV
ncbi:MAG TPA: adenylate/guanylate cyclase domain-containing protein [Sphingomicrobium sp.]|nr:adenylate/guanylate cyclase domain-containing protein [Sphingomicrobium sp.]